MNGDPSYMAPLLDNYPISMIFTSAYMVFSGFAILSVLTGIVCDKMSKAAEDESNKLEEADCKVRLDDSKQRLLDLFRRIDVNESGSLDKGEWECIKEDEEMCHELCDLAQMEKSDLHLIWEALSKSEKMLDSENVEAINLKDWME